MNGNLLFLCVEDLSPQMMLHLGYLVELHGAQLTAYNDFELDVGYVTLFLVFLIRLRIVQPIDKSKECEPYIIWVATCDLYNLFEIHGQPQFVLLICGLGISFDILKP